MKLNRILLDRSGYAMFMGVLEQDVIERLYERSLTLRALHNETVLAGKQWSYSTINETLRRLTAKGWIKCTDITHPSYYTGIYSLDDIVQEHLAHLIKQYLASDLDPYLLHNSLLANGIKNVL